MKYLLLLLFGISSLEAKCQIIITIAGTGVAGYSGDGGAATNAQLHHPHSIKFDQIGNLYIADNSNHTIRKIDYTGHISTVVGNGLHAGAWDGGYSGDGGPATNAEISKPSDIVFDKLGNMYISEVGNSVIRKVNTSGIISTIAGIAGEGGYSGDGGPATNAKIANPFGLTFDTSGNLYFSNNGYYCVRKIDKNGIISTVIGTGFSGFSGDGGPSSSAKVQLIGHMAFDSLGQLFVPDYFNHRIRKMDINGNISTAIGNGIASNTGDGNSATLATINQMWAIRFDGKGNTYISDRIEPIIRKIDPSGIITTVAGNGSVGYNGDGGNPITASFSQDMHCSEIDNWGNLYIADPYNNRIRKIVFNVGMNEVSSDSMRINIYPNPASKNLTITANQLLNDLSVINILGQTVIANDANRKEIRLNVAHLPTGIYIIKVNGVYIGRFVKE